MKVEHSSADDRARAYSVSLNTLQTPNDRHKYRTDIAKAQNLGFLDLLQRTDNTCKFLDDVNFIVDNSDTDGWYTLVSMLKTLPEEMGSWTDYLDQLWRSSGFDVWKVCRMFANRLQRPESSSELLGFCRNNREGIFENHILERYEKTLPGIVWYLLAI